MSAKVTSHFAPPGLRAAWWFVAVSTASVALLAWLVHDWLSRPDPWVYLSTIGRRSAGFRVLSVPVLLVALADAFSAWFRPAVRIDTDLQKLRCRRNIFFSSYTIPLCAVHGISVHRHGLEHGVTVLSAFDPPTIPVRLPRGTSPESIERELCAAVGLGPARCVSGYRRRS